jgi:hypothetical protein
MALTAREQQALDQIARRVRAEDPSFARRLATFGARGARVTRRRWLPITVVVVIAVLGVLLLPQDTAHGWSDPGFDESTSQPAR